jgi:uncharacterized protein (TIGR03089 family)
VLRALLDDDPGRPRVTWYGPYTERVELSAKILDSRVARTANLLVDEMDTGPGATVAIALPPHWLTAVWLLAAWSTGACAVAVPVNEAAPHDLVQSGIDVLVAADPVVLAKNAPDARKVAVALPSLAMSFGPELPDNALDATLAVQGHGDVFVPFVDPIASDAAFRVPGRPLLSHGELTVAAAQAADEAGLPPKVRLFTGAGPDGALLGLLAPLVRLGSVVFHHDLPALSADPPALTRLCEQEAVTATDSAR